MLKKSHGFSNLTKDLNQGELDSENWQHLELH